MHTVLTDMLGLKHPIIQAPMAGVSTPQLAAAVSNAGGLGCVALGALPAHAAGRALQETLALTTAPIAANLFVHHAPDMNPQLTDDFLAEIRPDFESVDQPAPMALQEIYRSFNDDDDMLDILLERRPAAVSLHFGAATASRMRALKAAGIVVLATATSWAEARLLEESGVDVIVLQGYGAGGHSGAFLGPPDKATTGALGLKRLLGQVVADVALPVVAAGGLMTGSDVAQMIAAGATGAQMGTVFVGCPESLASDRYREFLQSGTPTRLTSNISGRPARALVNDLLLWADGIAAKPPHYPLCYDAVKQLVAAKRDPDFSVMWAGEGAGQCRFLPAADLLNQLVAELEGALEI